MLTPNQRFRIVGSEDIWRVLHVNESRAHCASERVEVATIGDRTFEATSRRTIDISPDSLVEVVSAAEVPVRTNARTAPLKEPTPGAHVITDGALFLRRIQISQAPGYRYDKVAERGRATEYRTERGAQRSFEEFAAGEPTPFFVKEG